MSRPHLPSPQGNEYDRKWASQLVNDLELLLGKMNLPIAKYTTHEATESRTLTSGATLSDIVSILNTLIKDLQTKGLFK